jgi:o-succinylbenzoate synthase
MKITSIKTYPLAVPMKKPIKMARQLVEKAETILVKIETDEGLSGFGETAAAISFSGETLLSMKYAIDRYVSPAITGEDPFDIVKINLMMEKMMAHNYGVKAAIDIALHDLVCRSMGVPLYQYLGGRIREDVRITWHVANANYNLDMETTAEGVDLGYEVFKLKVGTADIHQELKTVEAIRKKMGHIDLRLDANQGLNLTTAIPYIKRTESFEITFFEQPIDHKHLNGMAKICAAVTVPVAADEGIFTDSDVVANYEARAADIISLKLMKAGGITGVRRAAQVCHTLGFPIQMTSKIAETSVATAAAVHLGVSLPNVEYDCGTTNHFLQEDVVAEPLIPVKGRIRPFEKPGLGVEVLEEKLNRFLINN